MINDVSRLVAIWFTAAALVASALAVVLIAMAWRR